MEPSSPSQPPPSAPILPPPEYDALAPEVLESNEINNDRIVLTNSYEDDVALAIARSLQDRESSSETNIPTQELDNIESGMLETAHDIVPASVEDDAEIARRLEQEDAQIESGILETTHDSMAAFVEDDAEIARQIEQEERDAQMARNIQEMENRRNDARESAPVRGTVIRDADGNVTGEDSDVQDSDVRRNSCGRRFCNFSMMCATLACGVLLILFYGSDIWTGIGGDPDDLPPFFQDNWDDKLINGTSVGEFSRWQNKGSGLQLTLVNALTPDWEVYFNEAVSDWDKCPALHLSTASIDPDPDCTPISGKMKVCNGEYGLTSWTGLNEVYFEGRGSFIVSSVAKMNESYLKRSSAGEHQYVMCHELGHGFGLPHRDENTNNPDLGTCLDYTRRPEDNMRPDEQDYSNLAEMYGQRRELRISSLRARKQRDLSRFQSIVSKKPSYKDGRLLHQSGRKEVYETKLDGDLRLITTVLLAT